MAFAHPNGLSMLLDALASPIARFPAEVYNRDEESLPLGDDDRDLSELARGLRFATRQVATRPLAQAQRYQACLRNAGQLAVLLDKGKLVIDPLTVEELPVRARLQDQHGIGRGEAAGLVLALRDNAAVVFVSSDVHACRVARRLGVPYRTLLDVVVAWVAIAQPAIEEIDDLVDGLRNARFGLTQNTVDRIRRGALRKR
jgi:predicted nucleic acid-binding protein